MSPPQLGNLEWFTLGNPRTAQSSLTENPTVALLSVSTVVKRGASLKSCSLNSGGLWTIPVKGHIGGGCDERQPELASIQLTKTGKASFEYLLEYSACTTKARNIAEVKRQVSECFLSLLACELLQLLYLLYI